MKRFPKKRILSNLLHRRAPFVVAVVTVDIAKCGGTRLPITFASSNHWYCGMRDWCRKKHGKNQRPSSEVNLNTSPSNVITV
jgi:hypothetical protein